jgi:hypothetical protein
LAQEKTKIDRERLEGNEYIMTGFCKRQNVSLMSIDFRRQAAYAGGSLVRFAWCNHIISPMHDMCCLGYHYQSQSKIVILAAARTTPCLKQKRFPEAQFAALLCGQIFKANSRSCFFKFWL